jgi:hypothetical protein
VAFPFVCEEGFELGTRGVFDAETDSDSKLDFPHYSALSAIPGLAMPYRGAYCMRVDLAGGTADAYVQETGSLDTSAAGTVYARFYMWFGAKRGESITMAANDIFSVFQLWSATNTVEASIGIQYTTANGYRLCVSELAAGTGGSFAALPLNRWNLIEIKALVDSGVGNDGTIDVWLNGSALTQIATLDQGVITSGVLGALAIDAGTTKGVLLFDDFIVDDARIYGNGERFPQTLLMTTSGHAFVGPGCIDNITLMSGGGTDCVVSVFDTDEAETTDPSRIVAELKNTANNELVDPAGMPADVMRGAYISMSGTNPRALVKIRRALGYASDGAIRETAQRRTKRLP